MENVENRDKMSQTVPPEDVWRFCLVIGMFAAVLGAASFGLASVFFKDHFVLLISLCGSCLVLAIGLMVWMIRGPNR